MPSLVFISCCTQLSVDINDWKKSRCGRNIGRLLRSGDPRPPVHHAADEAAGHHQLAKGPTPGRGCFPACTRSWNSPSPRFHDLATIVGMRSSLVLLFCHSDIGMEMKERVRRSSWPLFASLEEHSKRPRGSRDTWNLFISTFLLYRIR
ncbi:uncharacterized protein LOC144123745 [Amblyomma americanum]